MAIKYKDSPVDSAVVLPIMVLGGPVKLGGIGVVTVITTALLVTEPAEFVAVKV